jgi:hypothetical protein
MNSFKRHIYKSTNKKQEAIELTFIPTSANVIAFLPDDEIVQVKSNADWEVGGTPYWFEINSGGNSGSGNGVFAINIQSNDGNSIRDYDLVVTATKGDEILIEEFKIIQAFEESTQIVAYYVAFERYSAAASCSRSPSIDIFTNNSNFPSSTILYATPDGLTRVPEGFYSLSGDVIQVDNDGERIGNAMLCENLDDDEGGSDFLTVSPENETVNPSQGSYGMAVNSNTSWTMSQSISWVKINNSDDNYNGTAGFDNGISVSVLSDNPTTSDRSGQITISTNTGSLTKSHTITQEGAPFNVGDLTAHSVTSAFDKANACAEVGAAKTVYSESATLSGSITLYSTSNGSSTVSAAFYSDGSKSLQCNSDGLVLDESNC